MCSCYDAMQRTSDCCLANVSAKCFSFIMPENKETSATNATKASKIISLHSSQCAHRQSVYLSFCVLFFCCLLALTWRLFIGHCTEILSSFVSRAVCCLPLIRQHHSVCIQLPFPYLHCSLLNVHIGITGRVCSVNRMLKAIRARIRRVDG